MADITPEKLAEAQAIVAAANRQAAVEAEAKRAAYFAPVKELVDSAAWRTVVETIQTVAKTYADDNLLSTHVKALAEIMPRLQTTVATAVPVTSAIAVAEVAAKA